MNKGVERKWTIDEVSRSGNFQVKATKYGTEWKIAIAISLITEVTYLLSVSLASFRWQELYLGLFTELGNLNIDEKFVVNATVKGFADKQKGNAQ